MRELQITITDEDGLVFATHKVDTALGAGTLLALLQHTDVMRTPNDSFPDAISVRGFIDDLKMACQNVIHGVVAEGAQPVRKLEGSFVIHVGVEYTDGEVGTLCGNAMRTDLDRYETDFTPLETATCTACKQEIASRRWLVLQAP